MQPPRFDNTEIEWKDRWIELKEGLDGASRACAALTKGFLNACSRERFSRFGLAALPQVSGRDSDVARQFGEDARRTQRRLASEFREKLRETTAYKDEVEAFAVEAAEAEERALEEAGGPLLGTYEGYEGHIQRARRAWTEETRFFSELNREIQGILEDYQRLLQEAFDNLRKGATPFPQAGDLLNSVSWPEEVKQGDQRGVAKRDKRRAIQSGKLGVSLKALFPAVKIRRPKRTQQQPGEFPSLERRRKS